MIRSMGFLALVVVLGGCGNEGTTEQVEPEPSDVVAEPEVEVEGVVEEIDEMAVPLPEDFAAETEATITTENYAAALDELEGEIGEAPSE